jgi:putative transposase
MTYVPMAHGFLYLVAVIDWASRAVLSWRLSNTLDADFCVEALEEAIQHFGRPEIFNTEPTTLLTRQEKDLPITFVSIITSVVIRH